MTSPLEARYVSQYSAEVLGLEIHVSGELADPQGSSVAATMVSDETSSTILVRNATRVGTGLYEITLTSNESSVPGPYTITWSFVVSGQSKTYKTAIQVGVADPAYDSLVDNMQAVVDNVWMRFADLFDSAYGGPHLQMYFQSHFGRGRIAQLMRVAVGLLNTTAQPYQTYTIDGDGGASFPVMKWGPLLEQATYVEVVKHLRRSYVEQPLFQGSNASVTRLDRRDYMDRWGMILEDEQATLKRQLDVFKMANMGLGKPQVLVSGGVYGRYGPTRYAGMAARPRYWARFYS